MSRCSIRVLKARVTTTLIKTSKAHKIDYFVGPNGNPTVDPNRHIHVIHDEKKQEVTLLLTDRTREKISHRISVLRSRCLEIRRETR